MGEPETEDDPVRGEITIRLARDAVAANADQLGKAALSLIDAAGTIIVHAHQHHGADGALWARHYAHHLIDQVEIYTRGGK